MSPRTITFESVAFFAAFGCAFMIVIYSLLGRDGAEIFTRVFWYAAGAFGVWFVASTRAR